MNILKSNIVSTFQKEFNSNPLLIFSPGRINLIGEHTDYNNGYVFPAAIDKGIFLAIEKSKTKTSKIIALDFNDYHEFLLDKAQPIKQGGWKNYVLGIISEIQKLEHKIDSVNIVFGGNIPIGAGLSSSAALENAVVFGLNELFQLGLTKKEMIHISQKAEHNFVGVNCGIMDQYASMFGKKSTALLLDCKTLEAISYEIDFKDYEFLLINTKVSHNLADSAYNERRHSCERVCRALKKDSLRNVNKPELLKKQSLLTKDDYKKSRYVLDENDRVIEASKAIENNDLKTLGALLYKSHEGLSNEYNVSCEELDFLVNEAKNNSEVLGARMMGGGFGGCTLNLIHSSAVENFKQNIAIAYQKRFKLECEFYSVQLSEGTHLIS